MFALSQLQAGVMAREATGKALRIIFAGKPLQNDATLASAGVIDGSTMHCALSAVLPPASSTQAAPSAQGAQLGARGVRGFSRLRALGLDDDEIAALRAYFFPQVFANEAHFPRLPGEDEPDRVVRFT